MNIIAVQYMRVHRIGNLEKTLNVFARVTFCLPFRLKNITKMLCIIILRALLIAPGDLFSKLVMELAFFVPTFYNSVSRLNYHARHRNLTCSSNMILM